MSTLLWWSAGLIAAALIAGAVLLIVRFNQLSLARDLCSEGRRQLRADIFERRTLIPSFLESCSGLTDEHPGITSRVEAVGDAFAAARQATGPEAVGRAEERLTVALAQLHQVLGVSQPGSADPTSDAEYVARALFIQMSVVEARIAADTRYFNANVARYRHRRCGILPALMPGRFPVIEPMPYGERDFDLDTGPTDAVSTADSDYRPGRLSEGR